MKVPLSHLRHFVNISDIQTEVLASALNTKVMELKSLHKLSEVYRSLKNVFVGKICEIKKLNGGYRKLVVRIGSNSITIVVSTNFTLDVGMNVAVAPIGAKLHSGITIQPKQFGQILSEGTLVSEADLGIGDIKEEPLLFLNNVPNGLSLFELLELDDVVFEFDVEPNRPDLFSIYGFSREIGAIFDKPIKELETETLCQLSSPDLEIKIEDKNLCKRYCALIIENVKVMPSPLWIQNRLRKVDIRPINNIVDLTNYITIELGQPLHAFDLDKIKEKIIVRSAREGEKLASLDGKQRILQEEMCIIADNNGPIALGGIIGGELTSISENTKRIVIESATFDPVFVRKASRILGVRTEASTRFEKGLPIELAPLALKRFAYLFKRISRGTFRGFIDISLFKEEKKTILLRNERVNKILGSSLSEEEILKILKKLNFEYRKINNEVIEVIPPYFRKDINIEEDLIEEIGRIYGYDKIPYTLPYGELFPPSKNWNFLLENKAKDTLVGCGLTEVQTSSLYGEKEVESFSINKGLHLELANPLSEDRKYLRLSLAPQIVLWTKENLKRFVEFSIFEIGKIYIPTNKIAVEKRILCGSCVSRIKVTNKNTDFYKTKNILNILLKEMGLEMFEFIPLNLSSSPSPEKISDIFYDIKKIFHPYRSALINTKNDVIGIIGEIHPSFLKELDIDFRITLFDIDFQKVCNLATIKKEYKEFSKFPAIDEDYSFIVDKDILIGEMIKSIYQSNKELIKEVKVIDIYEGGQIEKGKKSVTFTVTFQAFDHTLSRDEIEKVRGIIVRVIRNKFGGGLRRS